MGQAQQNRGAVLIVEDDAELREFVARLLEDGELDTIECSVIPPRPGGIGVFWTRAPPVVVPHPRMPPT